MIKNSLFILMTMGMVSLIPKTGDGYNPANNNITQCGVNGTSRYMDLVQSFPEKSALIEFNSNGINEPLVKVNADAPTTILMEIVPELMKFNMEMFTVTAGDKIILELDNLDGMQHNLLIVKPGTLNKVGAAADAMVRDPKASEKHYVPDMAEVLFATEMLDPFEVFTLNFTAPSEPGDYPFVCTFPGHWRMMNGIMRVKKAK
ncbi:plastocyanin/azurin family copper-binding protein [Anditalea andensis]|uniref:plastocyanin/azurin family copper-binding protein n=1 Tax=Anditalea andensis TaxID=1048983 RepID=UPI00055706CD|nr:plastocyanin/azurin family copper-binding protein [Anditalea andensis]